MPKHDLSKGFQGPKTGPNPPPTAGAKGKANANAQQTITTAKASYKKVSGRKN